MYSSHPLVPQKQAAVPMWLLFGGCSSKVSINFGLMGFRLVVVEGGRGSEVVVSIGLTVYLHQLQTYFVKTSIFVVAH